MELSGVGFFLVLLSNESFGFLSNLAEAQASCNAEGPFNNPEVNRSPVRDCS